MDLTLSSHPCRRRRPKAKMMRCRPMRRRLSQPSCRPSRLLQLKYLLRPPPQHRCQHQLGDRRLPPLRHRLILLRLHPLLPQPGRQVARIHRCCCQPLPTACPLMQRPRRLGLSSRPCSQPSRLPRLRHLPPHLSLRRLVLLLSPRRCPHHLLPHALLPPPERPNRLHPHGRQLQRRAMISRQRRPPHSHRPGARHARRAPLVRRLLRPWAARSRRLTRRRRTPHQPPREQQHRRERQRRHCRRSGQGVERQARCRSTKWRMTAATANTWCWQM